MKPARAKSEAVVAEAVVVAAAATAVEAAAVVAASAAVVAADAVVVVATVAAAVAAVETVAIAEIAKPNPRLFKIHKAPALPCRGFSLRTDRINRTKSDKTGRFWHY
jgi:hypothetical protein